MFIAMAYYDGETLKKRIARGPLAIGEALDIAIQIAQGLAEAHAAGIVHRDIKPANVMFTKGGQVKIVDFGIAKLSGQMGLTQTGTTLGTVAYMSPEQTRGGPGDQQTDIWSLGVVLYEMVTGQLPFPGGHPLGLMNAIQYEQPVPIRQLRLGIPDELERIVSRVLEKNREARYVSADELQRDLVTCRTALASPSLQVPALFQMLRTPKVAVLALVVLLLISLGAIWAYTRGADARWARQEAIPRILTLVGERNYQAAFDLAEKAERYIPADPLLASLWPQFTRTIKVESDPPGAQLYAKPFADVDGDWRSLGGTPLEARFPVGARWIQQLKLEKPGYETILDINYPFSDSLRLTLHAAGTRPAGMVWVSGASPPLRLPGLESLQAEPVDGFLVDQFEVTNRAYKEFVDAGGYRDQRLWRHPITADGRTLPWEEAMSLFRDTTGRLGPSTWEGGTFASGMDDHPVGGVSWYEAVAYAEFTNKRLPTIFHWNRVAITAAASQSVPLSNIDRSELGPVGSHQAIHRSGTRDLAGNVREWVWNETSRTGERFILGGGWSDPPYKFNDSYAALALDRSAINGFRCITLADETADIERVSRMIELPSLDFFAEEPVGDEEFEVLLRQFAYDRTDLNATIEYSREEESLTRQKITFDAAYGDERVTAYVFLPEQGTPPYQTLVYFPGSGVIFADSSEEDLSIRVLDFTVKSGRALFYPIYKGTFERQTTLRTDQPTETALYWDHVVMWAKDLDRSVDYLETRDDIDTNKLAYLGRSWGARMGPLMVTVDGRFEAAVFDLGGLKLQRTFPEADPFTYVPRVQIPVLMINGRYDHYFPVETSQRPMFEILGTPDEHKRWVVYDGGHYVPQDKRVEEVLTWLDRYLGAVP